MVEIPPERAGDDIGIKANVPCDAAVKRLGPKHACAAIPSG